MKNSEVFKMFSLVSFVVLIVLALTLASCGTGQVQCDAYGTIDNQEIDKV